MRAWITKDRSEVGHIGDPAAASAAKGETLLRVFTADVVSLLNRVIAWDGTSWSSS
jgi:creatinine amidohydrolase